MSMFPRHLLLTFLFVCMNNYRNLSFGLYNNLLPYATDSKSIFGLIYWPKINISINDISFAVTSLLEKLCPQYI